MNGGPVAAGVPRFTRMRLALRIGLWVLLLAGAQPSYAFDHTHAAWNTLLKRHVAVSPGGSASRFDYAGARQDRAALHAYLDGLSAVTEAEYRSWAREARLAFLINAYNAFTVQLVLTGYPGLKSIKDLGTFLRSPWKKAFFQLLGAERSLDDLEHGLIRAPGAFDDPRIHFAVNCASIGCPMLRDEAFVADRLDAQLEDGARRFIADRSRNRYDTASGRLEISRIFDWYKADFEKGHRGIHSVAQFLSRHADHLAADAPRVEAVRAGRAPIRYLGYDWGLNDTRH